MLSSSSPADQNVAISHSEISFVLVSRLSTDCKAFIDVLNTRIDRQTYTHARVPLSRRGSPAPGILGPSRCDPGRPEE